MLSRRHLLGHALAVGTVAAIGPKAVAAAPTPASLGDLAAHAGLMFGASIGHEIDDDADYAQLYVRQTRIVTTDTALQFDYLRPNEGTFDFAPADRIFDFAARHRLLVRGHPLAWNEIGQKWLHRLPLRDIARAFDRHIDTVVERYAGRVQSWNVVNEPFWPDHGKPGGYRQGPWLDAMGPAYVKRAFRRVAAIDKTAKLCLNEATCENDRWGGEIRPRLLRLIDELRDDGLPLGVVGLQGHLAPQWVTDPEAFPAFMAELAKRDVDIYVTELDVDDSSFVDNVIDRDEAVAACYATFLREVLRYPRVKMVGTWQLADSYSYYRTLALRADPTTRRIPRPLPFGEAFEPKLAFDATVRAFAARST